VKPFLRVRQKASTIGQVEYTRRVIKGLGLRGLGSQVVVANTPSFRGMVKKVMHLVEIEEIETKDGESEGGIRGAVKKARQLVQKVIGSA
jgi:large subunit ribosomal protein L30